MSGIFIFIVGTIFGAILMCMGFLRYIMKNKKKIEQGSEVQSSSGVVYEEINSAESTSSKPIELQGNATYGRMQSHQ